MFKTLVLFALVGGGATNMTGSQTPSQSNALLPDIVDPLVVRISPKIFTLIERGTFIVNEALNMLSTLSFNGTVVLADYKVSNISVERYSISSNNLTFQDFSEGVHLKIKGVTFLANASIGLVIILPWQRTTMEGNVTASSDNVEIDAKLKWDNDKFEFTPTFSVKSNIVLKFGKGLELAEAFKETFLPLVNVEVERQLYQAVKKLANPYLQQLKMKLINARYYFLFNDPLKWMVENGTLQITMREKRGNSTVYKHAPDSKMVCVSGNIVQVFMPKLSSLMSPSRTRREAAFAPDFMCSEPRLSCVRTTCSFCTDIHLTSSPVSLRRKIWSCIPRINFMDWLWRSITSK